MDASARTVCDRLVEAASRRQTVSYTAAGAWVGLSMESPAHRQRLGQILDRVNLHEHEAGRPLLSALVVYADTGIPGRGFFDLATRLGHHRPGDDDVLYWTWECERLYAEWSRE